VNLSVRLAGHTSTWEFRDSAALEGWCRNRPWVEGGGIQVARISSAGYAQEMALALRRAIRAHDDALSEVRVELLQAEELAHGIAGALRGRWGISPSLPRREQLLLLSHHFISPPRVLVLNVAGTPLGLRLLEEAEQLADEIPKLESAAVFSLVLIDTGSALRSAAYDLCVGGPQDQLLRSLDVPLPVVWYAYVHARLAWEVSGDLSKARRWDEDGFGTLSAGDDDGLEQLLNKLATAEAAQVKPELRKLLDEYLKNAVLRHLPQQKFRDLERELLLAGLLWRPQGETWARPVAWLARACLRADANHPARVLLRSCLICKPLAQEIFSRCLNLEARERTARLAAVTLSPTEETLSRFRHFQQAEPMSEVRFYPMECPATPSDPWAFASFGEMLKMVVGDRRLAPELYELRDIRNAIAHGHYPAWRMVTTLRTIGQQLGG